MAEGAEQEPAPDYLSVAQVARRLGCSVSLVQKWRRLGWLPAARLGTTDVAVYGYLPADVEHFARVRWNRRRGRPPGSVATKTPARPSTFLPVRTGDVAPAPARPAHERASALAQSSPGPSANTTSAAPLSGRPLVLWDDDPRDARPLVLARFSARELDQAMAIGAAWSRRYATVALGELTAPGDGLAPAVIAVWRDGVRQ